MMLLLLAAFNLRQLLLFEYDALLGACGKLSMLDSYFFATTSSSSLLAVAVGAFIL
jgi:hypothetical protein